MSSFGSQAQHTCSCPQPRSQEGISRELTAQGLSEFARLSRGLIANVHTELNSEQGAKPQIDISLKKTGTWPPDTWRILNSVAMRPMSCHLSLREWFQSKKKEVSTQCWREWKLVQPQHKARWRMLQNLRANHYMIQPCHHQHWREDDNDFSKGYHSLCPLQLLCNHNSYCLALAWWFQQGRYGGSAPSIYNIWTFVHLVWGIGKGFLSSQKHRILST